MSMQKDAARNSPVKSPSPALITLFSAYLRWYVPRHFHALRIANPSRLQVNARPLIVYLNHPSWWDPLVCMVVARRYLRDHVSYAPMDAVQLERHSFMGSLGLFPVEQGTRRGAAQFLRAALDVVSKTDSILWVTPQGSFTDIRQRPIVFKPGLSALIARIPNAVAVPLTIEYTYWDERLPEILVNVGEPQTFDAQSTAHQIELQLTGAMTTAQDALADLAIQRNALRFETILSGAAGVGFFYDVWQRFIALLRGKSYRAEHTQLQSTSSDTTATALSATKANRTKERSALHL